MIPVGDLKRLKIFSGIDDVVLGKLANDIEKKEYASQDVILAEGDSSGSLYIIAKGSVSIEKKTEGGEDKSKTVARLEEEEFFGEMAFLENEPHSASVVALEQAVIFKLPRKSLDRVFTEDPKSALDQVLTLFSGVSARLRHTTSELVTLYEVARAVAQTSSLKDLVARVSDQVSLELGPNVSLGFYRWNQFNEEYTLEAGSKIKDVSFPETIEPSEPLMSSVKESEVSSELCEPEKKNLAPFSFSQGEILLSPIAMPNAKEALLVCYSPQSQIFTSAKKHMLETISSVLAPSLATIRDKEEDESRKRLEQSRNQGYTI